MFCNKKPAIHETWTKWQILLGPGQQRGLQPHPASPLSTETKSFPQADELPIPWAPATLKKNLQSTQVLLDARIGGRIESWCCPIQQGWTGVESGQTQEDNKQSQFFRGNQGTKKPQELRREWWCSGMDATLEGACCYQSRCYYSDWEPEFVLPPKQKQQTPQPIINLAHRLHKSRQENRIKYHRPSSWLHLGPSLSLQIHQWLIGWPQSPPLDLILIHWFAFLAWPGSASSPQTCLVTWALGWICPSCTGLLTLLSCRLGWQGETSGINSISPISSTALNSSSYRLQILSTPDEQHCRSCSLDKKKCSLSMSVHP